jgi:hypothetical protein
MFTTIFHYQATDVDSNPVCVRACAYVCVCVNIMGDCRVAAYLVDTNIHVITPLSIIISAKISID